MTTEKHTAHTPGPWEWAGWRNETLFAPGPTPVLQAVGSYCDDLGIEIKAQDATLIAAAPQMLEALRDAQTCMELTRDGIDNFERYDGSTGLIPGLLEAERIIAAAVAAAEGRDDDVA